MEPVGLAVEIIRVAAPHATEPIKTALRALQHRYTAAVLTNRVGKARISNGPNFGPKHADTRRNEPE